MRLKKIGGWVPYIRGRVKHYYSQKAKYFFMELYFDKKKIKTETILHLTKYTN